MNSNADKELREHTLSLISTHWILKEGSLRYRERFRGSIILTINLRKNVNSGAGYDNNTTNHLWFCLCFVVGIYFWSAVILFLYGITAMSGNCVFERMYKERIQKLLQPCSVL